jgi:hypothetical protein
VLRFHPSMMGFNCLHTLHHRASKNHRKQTGELSKPYRLSHFCCSHEEIYGYKRLYHGSTVRQRSPLRRIIVRSNIGDGRLSTLSYEWSGAVRVYSIGI